ncbi:stage II sporulation protein M [Paenibacillus antri]|uniref:Stage II sporulation protein M n=1 Tax=Paenibacillus antri TaxID=2582848 RepID=A0A5R9G607_9BACL|nr:stage II sporulation protein M [Paenibacillus antri]TLS48384.1 stage II sporulation protein M [Paenibacillus antri]
MSLQTMKAFAKDLAAIRWYFAVSVALFFVGVAFGAGSEGLNAYLESQIEPMRGVAERLDATANPQVWMFLFIFINNFVKSLFVVFLGALFGLFPLFFLLTNGMILGYVAAVAGDSGANVFSLIVRGILPHGLLEITAILIAAAYGLKYGALVFAELVRAFRGGGSSASLKAFHGTFGRLIAFLFFALLVAAFIESTITYFLVRG